MRRGGASARIAVVGREKNIDGGETLRLIE
jgi:hypothetical protein